MCLITAVETLRPRSGPVSRVLCPVSRVPCVMCVCAEVAADGADGASCYCDIEFRDEVLALNHHASSDGDVVLIDCRNAYESRIGGFHGALRPSTRQFSDFPAWCRANRAQLQDKKLLMYCTGGIRCERASAYVLGQDVRIDRLLSWQSQKVPLTGCSALCVGSSHRT